MKEEVLATRCIKGNLSALPASLKTSAKASSNASSENYIDLSTWLSKNNVSWGLRLAYNGSTVLFEGLNYGLGHGAEAGLVANMPIPSTAVEISIGANGIYRKPYTKEIIDENSAYIKSELTEYVGSVPIMLKYNISNFYLQAGAQIDVPLKMEQKTTKGAEVTWEEVLWRSDRDLGVVFGLGFNINKNISLDIKAVGGVSEYNKEVGGYKLVQGSVGFSYLFSPSPAPTAVAPAVTTAVATPKDSDEEAKAETETVATPATTAVATMPAPAPALAPAPIPTVVEPAPMAVAPAPAPAVAATKDPIEGAKAELEAAANKWIENKWSSNEDMTAPNTDNFTFKVTSDGYGWKATSKVKIGSCPAKSVWDMSSDGCNNRKNKVPKDCKAITPDVITNNKGPGDC